MIPIWIDENEWECKKNGMYENGNDIEKIYASKRILTDFSNLKQKMEETTKIYVKSTYVNFTNKMFNPVSWLGQACCNIFANSKSQETAKAWMMMEDFQQKTANKIAKQVIEEWRIKHENLY